MLSLVRIFLLTRSVVSPIKLGHYAGLTQLVECQLPKLNVAGSSPVLRSHLSVSYYPTRLLKSSRVTIMGKGTIKMTLRIIISVIFSLNLACESNETSSMLDRGGEMTGGEVMGGETTGGEMTSIALSEMTLWRSPIETYIDEATTAIGPEIDKGIHDLFVFNDRLYIGYGDADLNAGGVSPIQILSFNTPEGEVSAESLETGEEGIYRYRLIDGELMIAGLDSTDADELTSRPLIEGNFLRTRNGVWEKYRAIQGGEHVHDVTRFMEGLWAVGSGADNRMEWETYGVYRYLWFSDDGGVTWRRYKRVFREESGDTRFINLLSVGPRLFIFGFLNPAEGPIVPKNEMILGATGEPTPLATEEGDNEIHPFANVYVESTYPISEVLGIVSGFDLDERKWRVWQVMDGGQIEALTAWGDRRLIDLSVNQQDNRLTLLFNDNNEGDASSGVIMHGQDIDHLTELTLLSFDSTTRPLSISQWGEFIFMGRVDGQIWRGQLRLESK